MASRIGELNYGDIDEGDLLIRQGRNLVGIDPSALTGSSSVFVYAEGGVAVGNIYTSFADAHAAASLVASGERIIYFDDTASPGNSFIPAGAWDMDGGKIHLVGPVSFGGGTLVDVQDGATLVEPSLIRGNLELMSTSTSPIITAGAGAQPPLIVSDGATLQADGTAPFIFLGPGAFYVIALEFGGRLRASTSAAVDVNDFSAVFQAVVFDSAQIDDTVVGNGIAFAIAFGSGITLVLPQTGLTFPMTVTPQEQAVYTAYTPAVPGNWAPPPVEVAEALDQLAAAGGGGGDDLGNHIASMTLEMNTQNTNYQDEAKLQYEFDATNTYIEIENGGQTTSVNQAGNVVVCVDTDNDSTNAFFGIAADAPFSGAPVQQMQMFETGHLAVNNTGRVGSLSDVNSSPATWEVEHTPGTTSGIRTALMTTADRDSAGGSGGLIVYNSDIDEFQGHDNSNWVPMGMTYGKQQGLVDGAVVSWDAAVIRNAVLITTQAALTLQNPTNLQQGLPLLFLVQCNQAGGTTLNFDTQYFDADTGLALPSIALAFNETRVLHFVSTNGTAVIKL